MPAEPMEPPRTRSFKDTSPREIRAALIPEEQPDFDRQWRKALTEAADSLDMADVFRVLESRRRRATITTHLGHHSDNPKGALRQLPFGPDTQGIAIYPILEDRLYVDTSEVMRVE